MGSFATAAPVPEQMSGGGPSWVTADHTHARIEDVTTEDSRMASGIPAGARTLSNRVYAALGVPDNPALVGLDPKDLAGRIHRAGLAAAPILAVYEQAGSNSHAGAVACLDAYRAVGKTTTDVDDIDEMKANARRRLQGLRDQLGTILYGQRAQQDQNTATESVLAAGHELQAEIDAVMGKVEAMRSFAEFVGIEGRIRGITEDFTRVDALAQRSFGDGMQNLELGTQVAEAGKDGLVFTASTLIHARAGTGAGSLFDAGIGALDTVVTADANGDDVDMEQLGKDAAIDVTAGLATGPLGRYIDKKTASEGAKAVLHHVAEEGVVLLAEVSKRVSDGESVADAVDGATSDLADAYTDPQSVATMALQTAADRGLDKRPSSGARPDGASPNPHPNATDGGSTRNARHREDPSREATHDRASEANKASDQAAEAPSSQDHPHADNPKLKHVRKLLGQSSKLEKTRKKLIEAGIANPTLGEMAAIAGIEL